jgi:formate dehydrogenase maturation protein FdhE
MEGNTMNFPRVYVHCHHCQTRFNENMVKCTNIEENELGQDVITFTCPECKKTTTSLRVTSR